MFTRALAGRTRVDNFAHYAHFSAMPPKFTKSGKPSLTIPDPPLDTPALKDHELCYSYDIARGEMGVLSFEPYKSLILPYWAFRTVSVAKNSAEVLLAIFQSYLERDDFVGADMTRKYIQMGMTRARRYANHKGGKYVSPILLISPLFRCSSSSLFQEIRCQRQRQRKVVRRRHRWKAQRQRRSIRALQKLLAPLHCRREIPRAEEAMEDREGAIQLQIQKLIPLTVHVWLPQMRSILRYPSRSYRPPPGLGRVPRRSSRRMSIPRLRL